MTLGNFASARHIWSGLITLHRYTTKLQFTTCTVCGCPRAEHSTDKSKEDHIFDKQALRDSHAYSDKMLQRVCGNKNDEVIWDATKGPKAASRKPSTCCWSLLCKQCEQSTRLSMMTGIIRINFMGSFTQKMFWFFVSSLTEQCQ